MPIASAKNAGSVSGAVEEPAGHRAKLSAAASAPPTSWATTYETRPVTSIAPRSHTATETAGLRCAPEM